MTQTFLPPPESKRCAAVTWRYFASRCSKRHLAGSDLCRRHRDMELAAQMVQRVRAPRRETE